MITKKGLEYLIETSLFDKFVEIAEFDVQIMDKKPNRNGKFSIQIKYKSQDSSDWRPFILFTNQQDIEERTKFLRKKI